MFSLIWNYAIACHKTTHEPCGKGVNGFSFGHYISWNLHYNINFLPYCQGLVFSNFVIGDLNNLCKDFYFWIAYASITKKNLQIQNYNDILTIKHYFINETMKNMITFKGIVTDTLVFNEMNILMETFIEKSTP